MLIDRKLSLIFSVRYPSLPLIYSTLILICLPDPLPLVIVVITSSNETSEVVIGSSVLFILVLKAIPLVYNLYFRITDIKGFF